MLNLDTHIVIYLLNGELVRKEIELIETNELAISDIVLWELCKLVQLKRLEFDMYSPDFHSLLLNLTVFPISLEIATASTQLDFRGDPADEIIAATSLVENIPLLTRDQRIRKSKKIPFA
jgi:PIN domain nuclease of toxin-antitoxin system